MKIRFWLISGLLILLFWGCDNNVSEPQLATFDYTTPPQLNDGLTTVHINEVDVDPGELTNMLGLIEAGIYENIHSVLLVKDNRLFIEEYWAGRTVFNDYVEWDRNTLHNMHSVTKSITSALIGIAIMEGRISSVAEKLHTFFPEYSDVLLTGGRDAITLEHALTMSAGLQWDEHSFPYEDERNDHAQMYESDDWIKYVVDRAISETPGTKFNYNSGLSITLGGIIRNVSGQTVDEYAASTLFAALGIADYAWFKDEDGTAQTGGGLSLRPRDMVKFGLLFLNEGQWNGSQIISPEWVTESTDWQAPGKLYGYQWWLDSYNIDGETISGYSARGRGGQFIFIFPDLKLVAIFTGGNDNQLGGQPYEMLVRHILPAVQ